MKLEDESIMPWGVHKGKRMIDVPYYTLLWYYRNKKCYGDVKTYIEENMNSLIIEETNNQSKFMIEQDSKRYSQSSRLKYLEKHK